MDLACAQCGQPVTVDAARGKPSAYVHVITADDGHKAELPPVTVTYRRDGRWHEAHCAELGGLLISALDFETAHSVVWTGLRRFRPPRNVREVFEGYEDR